MLEVVPGDAARRPAVEAVDRRLRECHQDRRVGGDDELALPRAGHLAQQRQQRQLADR
jgi:hypothetical protein